MEYHKKIKNTLQKQFSFLLNCLKNRDHEFALVFSVLSPAGLLSLKSCFLELKFHFLQLNFLRL